jgi:hypothetical protein
MAAPGDGGPEPVIVGQLHDRVLVDPSRQTDRKVIKFWDTRQHSLESLQNNLRNYSWNHITLDDARSVDEQYNDLVTCLHWHINACIPLKTVTLKDGRPSYVTP